MIRTSRAFWWALFASLVVGVISFVSGVLVTLYWGGEPPLAGILGPASALQSTTPADVRRDFNVYWETWNLVEREFYHKAPLNHQDMVYGSIEGMLKSLGDDYTFFQRPEEAAKTRESMAGTFEGIGAYIEAKDGKIRIVAPIEGSPAERAGLQSGDILVKIDSAELTPLIAKLDTNAATQKAIDLIRGPKGTTVKMLVQRPPSNRLLTIAITRDAVPEISVQSKLLNSGVAWITLSGFKGTTTAELDKALQTVLITKPKGIVLDIRNNGGGLVDTAQEVLGRFLDGGTAFYEEYGDGRQEEKPVLRSGNDPRAFDVPMVVLINGGSASASEIVAGALRDRGRATLLGEKSFGKGSVQSVERLSDNSLARITIAHWLTPNKAEIHKIGIMPKYVVPYSTDARYHIELPQKYPTDPTSVNDSQLWWAIKLLTTKESPPSPSIPAAAK
ncbi:MAG TPA: S41 family peptidase [Herpetosiphonaceae bacterium]|nr:S41 family peptidase [Herpetosiphonaceae bacterium]